MPLEVVDLVVLVLVVELCALVVLATSMIAS
jgi:hypothetical protein